MARVIFFRISGHTGTGHQLVRLGDNLSDAVPRLENAARFGYCINRRFIHAAPSLSSGEARKTVA